MSQNTSKSQLEGEEEEPSFFSRHRLWILGGLVVAAGLGVSTLGKSKKTSRVQRRPEVVMIMPVIPPPVPPPPPPPQKVEPPPEQQEKEVAAEEEPPPDAPENKAPEAKPSEEALGTAIAGGDGSGLGLGGGGGGAGMIGGGSGGKTYSERGRWQSRFSRQLQELLQNDPILKFAKGSVVLRVWLDEAGRITRVALGGSTGDSSQDQALRQSALVGRLIEPAPTGTPMPVKLRFSAR